MIRVAVLMACGFALGGCATMRTPALPATAGATFCQTAQPIYWSSADTRKTKEQVDEHNRVWKRLCAAKPRQP